MNKDTIAKIVKDLNGRLVKEEATIEDVEVIIHSLSRHLLDNLVDIADVDYFQDRLNNMIDKYVDTQFEDVYDNGAY